MPPQRQRPTQEKPPKPLYDVVDNRERGNREKKAQSKPPLDEIMLYCIVHQTARKNIKRSQPSQAAEESDETLKKQAFKFRNHAQDDFSLFVFYHAFPELLPSDVTVTATNERRLSGEGIIDPRSEEMGLTKHRFEHDSPLEKAEAFYRRALKNPDLKQDQHENLRQRMRKKYQNLRLANKFVGKIDEILKLVFNPYYNNYANNAEKFSQAPQKLQVKIRMETEYRIKKATLNQAIIEILSSQDNQQYAVETIQLLLMGFSQDTIDLLNDTIKKNSDIINHHDRPLMAGIGLLIGALKRTLIGIVTPLRWFGDWNHGSPRPTCNYIPFYSIFCNNGNWGKTESAQHFDRATRQLSVLMTR